MRWKHSPRAFSCHRNERRRYVSWFDNPRLAFEPLVFWYVQQVSRSLICRECKSLVDCARKHAVTRTLLEYFTPRGPRAEVLRGAGAAPITHPFRGAVWVKSSGSSAVAQRRPAMTSSAGRSRGREPKSKVGRFDHLQPGNCNGYSNEL